MEMLLTGDMVAAEDAARIGLINRVVAPGEERKSRARARQARSRRNRLTCSRSASRRSTGRPRLGLAEAYNYASEVMTENMMARDAEEGICAFIDKRDPTWEDR